MLGFKPSLGRVRSKRASILIKVSAFLSAATVIVLAGCSCNDGAANQPATGAIITNTGSQLGVILPEGVALSTGSATAASSFLPALREVARSLNAHPNSTVRVADQTENVGSAAYNQQLSEDRALAVARILIRDGASPSRKAYSGRGRNEPITTSATAAGRARNRRVEIVITPAR